MSNTDSIKNRGWTQVPTKGSKRFLPLIRHPPCYSYIQCVLNTSTIRKQIQNKTWALLQTNLGKDEPNIVFMRNRSRYSNAELGTLWHMIIVYTFVLSRLAIVYFFDCRLLIIPCWYLQMFLQYHHFFCDIRFEFFFLSLKEH
jgi:hypothetical protein